MARHIPRLRPMDQMAPITGENHYQFLYHLQSALLLSLREQGRLDAMEYHWALEALNRQRRERTRFLLEKDAHV